MAREAIGQFKCVCCGQLLPVKRGVKGSISISCPWCDFSGYGKPGTQAHKIISDRIIGGEPVPDVAPKAEPKKESNGWMV